MASRGIFDTTQIGFVGWYFAAFFDICGIKIPRVYHAKRGILKKNDPFVVFQDVIASYVTIRELKLSSLTCFTSICLGSMDRSIVFDQNP